MAKAEWGLKRVCPGCGARYYDMRKNPPVCPTCGVKFDPDALLKSRRIRAAGNESKRDAAAKRVAMPVDPELAVPAVEGVEVGKEDDDALIEDAAELGEEEDVVDVEEDEA